MMRRLALVAGVVVAAVAARQPTRAPAAAPPSMEGTFEYVGTLKGQSSLAGGRFVFLYGPADGSAPMTGDAGTYQISREAPCGGGRRTIDESRRMLRRCDRAA